MFCIKILTLLALMIAPARGADFQADNLVVLGTVTYDGAMVVAGTVTASYFSGDGSHLTNVSVSVDLTSIGIATASLRTDLSVLATSTGPLVSYTNWNTAYGWGDHSAAGYASSTTLAAVILSTGGFVQRSGDTMTGTLMGVSGGGDWELNVSGGGSGEFRLKNGYTPGVYLNGGTADNFIHGRIGLGGQESPAYPLDVSGDVRSTGTVTAVKYYGDGSALTGLSISKSGLFYSTDTLPFSQLQSSSTLALSANVIPSSATGYYDINVASAAFATTALNTAPGGGDNLGNHVATKKLTMGAFDIVFSSLTVNNSGLINNGDGNDINSNIDITSPRILNLSGNTYITLQNDANFSGKLNQTAGFVENTFGSNSTFKKSVTVSSLTVTGGSTFKDTITETGTGIAVSKNGLYSTIIFSSATDDGAQGLLVFADNTNDYAAHKLTTSTNSYISLLPYQRLGVGVYNSQYKLDVNGGGHFSSSMTVDGGYYGDGSALTGVKTDLSGYFSSTGTLPFSQLASSSTLALRTEVSASTLTLTNRANGFDLGLSTAVSTSGSYTNPGWLTSVSNAVYATSAGSVPLSTVTARLNLLDANVSTAAHTNQVITWTSSQTITDPLGLSVTYGVYAGSITLTSGGSINVNGQNNFTLPTTMTSSVTVTANAFSIGGSTFIINAGGIYLPLSSVNTPAINRNSAIFYGSTSSGRPVFWATVAGTYIRNYDGDATDAIHFQSLNDAVDKMTILHSGSIGIGTTAPTAKLELKSSQGENVPVIMVSSQNAIGMMVVNGNGKVGIGTTAPQNSLDINGALVTGSYAGVVVGPSGGALLQGNVGIGTSAPSYSLHVNGVVASTAAVISGNLLMNGAPATGVLTCWGAGNKIGYCESNATCVTCTVIP